MNFSLGPARLQADGAGQAHQQRLDLGLVTVLCGRKLPPPNSMLGRLLTEYATIVNLPQLGA